MGAQTQGDYPRTIGEFHRRFPDDEACLTYLFETRWPNGFCCPHCGASDAAALATRRVWQCRRCRRQTSITSGTVLHRSKLPLTAWFTTAYLMASLKPGISSLQLSQQLGVHYETAWLMLHKLRRAMVNPDRGKLTGQVEVDETWVGGKQAGLKGGRQRKNRKALLVAVAVERRTKKVVPGQADSTKTYYLGRLRLEVIPDDRSETLGPFVERNVEVGSTVISDAWPGYRGLLQAGYRHLPLSQSAMKREGLEPDAVPGVHRVNSNLKTWLRGTHHGVGADHLDHYLNEFAFRFNRRFYPMSGFATLLGLGTKIGATPASQILSPLQAGATSRRKGRATGLTTGRFSIETNEAGSLEEARANLEARLDDLLAGPEPDGPNG